ncbi:hypothetical protein ACIGO9_30195 [Nocardia asteroides]|uniref:hypothetical protein n=1 Tax=Nocardia asteroides TaxID=1824 RepID=UPI0037C5D14A
MSEHPKTRAQDWPRFTVRIGDGRAVHHTRRHEPATLRGAEHRHNPTRGYRTLAVIPTDDEPATCASCLRLAAQTPR